jgi:hypothetical protein
MVVAKEHSDKEFTGERRKSTETITFKYIKQEQSNRNNEYLSGKQNSKK